MDGRTRKATLDAFNHFSLGASPNASWKRSSQANETSEQGLHLKISTSSITAVNGYTLYASPIALPDLLALLLAAYRDLRLSHAANDFTNAYHYNTSVWSFEVAVANRTIHYSSISSIVKSFLQLMQGPHESIITHSFVACLYAENNAIADIAIIPSATKEDSTSIDITPEYADTPQSPPDIPFTPVQINTISPTGIVTTTDIISQSALDIFNPDPDRLKKRRGFSIDHEIVVKVASTTLYIARRILLRNDLEHELANPVVAVALPYFFNAAIILAVSSFGLGVATEQSTHPYYKHELLGKAPIVDSRIFHLGRLTARFYMWSTLRDQDGRSVGFAGKVWDALVKQFLEVAERAPRDREVYATEGTVKGKDPVNGTDDYVTWARWEWKVRGTTGVIF
ncbi:MAG: hypothetical protein LQ350_001982 [Teloschistes chrysophthalmus]|nr:MAG: hypothetical protein LQ350_001982 [Niorma chrysophthalma]